MNFIPLFFICMRMFHFIHTKRIYYFLQGFAKLLEEKRRNPDRKQVILVDGTASIFIMYFMSDVLCPLYCIWLMVHDATWTPGFLLLIIAAMESLAIHARITGTYEVDAQGYVYPRMWFRYMTFAETMFILLKLFEGN